MKLYIVCFIVPLILLCSGQRRDKRCLEPPKFEEQPRCRAAISRWSYNQRTRTCEYFRYGGCNGNHNNFESAEQCMAICRTRNFENDDNEGNSAHLFNFPFFNGFKF
ncbi:hypothetical protein B4U80_05455 [Leptotrombidium deliense]|uniref:BPTI/Kunitz inhibitor domain-containing protein n=1 Tax=Leptotrombidium deliense TaxID=299467 RepID=A0A443SE73_9ACAR|nr:hypothetical protein B4U80_05455 [Leptotrombidium deliense]